MNIISEKINKNAWLFLRRAIQEINTHDDCNDQALKEESAVIASTFLQTSFELAVVRYVLLKEGLHGISSKGNKGLSENELIVKFNQNELITENIQGLLDKECVKNYIVAEQYGCLIDDFKNIRNKLLHLHYEFNQADLYDLKFDLILFIVKIIIPLLSQEQTDNPSAILENNLDVRDFRKLIKFPPFATEMNKLAREHATFVYTCTICGNDSMVVESDIFCFSCCTEFEFAAFIDCPYCENHKNTIIFDHLNIGFQRDKIINAWCINCQDDNRVYHCEKCDSFVPQEGMVDDFCYPCHCANS